MKRLNKEKIIGLLQSKNCTYKELAKLTGYHEKSLVRLHSQIKKKTISTVHGNKNRHPYNYINDTEKENLRKLWNQNEYKTYKEFYYALNKKYSYSFLCKLLPPKPQKKNTYINRKLIKDNLIQYQNQRYKIINGNIKQHSKVILNIQEMYILYNNKKYKLQLEKQLVSKKGNTKYS